MKLIKILGIAPYEELKLSMASVAREIENVELDLYTADLEEGQKLAKELSTNGYDAIISRGGTANLIEQVVSIPVIDVSISIYDILSAIKLAHNYTDNIAIVGFTSITKNAHLICDILQYNIKIITLNSPHEADQVLDLLKKDNYQLVLCDAITNQKALQKSINTILITSGNESISVAFNHAFAYIKHIQAHKEKSQLLQTIIQNQNQLTLVLSSQYQVISSNLAEDLKESLIKYLKKRSNKNFGSQFYHTHNSRVYQVKLKVVDHLNNNYVHCQIKESTPPTIHNKFGLTFHSKNEIKNLVSKKLLLTTFIDEKNERQIEKLVQYYHSMMIFGETGTNKTILAYKAYLAFEKNTENLIEIDSQHLNDRLWKYLINTTNGPFLESGNTFLIKNVEKLKTKDIDQIITLIKDIKLLQRNNIIFTYNSQNLSNNEDNFNYMIRELDSSSIYAESLLERKNELTSIITLLINKINIECNTEVIGFEPEALQSLISFRWFGNFSQLKSVITKLVLSTNSLYITDYLVQDILKEERKHQNFLLSHSENESNLPQIFSEKTLFDYNQDIVNAVLDQNDGNQTKTAKQLGISRTTLWRYLKAN
ncbi:hypothetical protein AT575_09375 [Streptococcus penaeicida]|uniref:Sigma-54 factor interaction domain-containing protein n=1 Tax=Streptococcus penaeicida TaxID=1765960 RepID=A0A2N8LA09_9STRE|nr:PrpR N-terminal domain-containing protein [Streptococcus penaeicida]PND46993.1 hypothetical protein AT575_09375 [Streptococcus penaeicida]